MPKYKGDSYQDADYDPDTDTPDTSEADQMVNDALGESESGVRSGPGHLVTLQRAEQEFSKATAAQNADRARAAKQMVRKPTESTESTASSEDSED